MCLLKRVGVTGTPRNEENMTLSAFGFRLSAFGLALLYSPFASSEVILDYTGEPDEEAAPPAPRCEERRDILTDEMTRAVLGAHPDEDPALFAPAWILVRNTESLLISGRELELGERRQAQREGFTRCVGRDVFRKISGFSTPMVCAAGIIK
jgi:hypothetical protein